MHAIEINSLLKVGITSVVVLLSSLIGPIAGVTLLRVVLHLRIIEVFIIVSILIPNLDTRSIRLHLSRVGPISKMSTCRDANPSYISVVVEHSILLRFITPGVNKTRTVGDEGRVITISFRASWIVYIQLTFVLLLTTELIFVLK